MNTLELLSAINSNAILKSSCIGVFAADQIPLPLSIHKSCIINTDPHQASGKHWILLYQKSVHELEFFCSYGMSPRFYHLYWVTLFQKYNFQILYNIRQVQNIYSNTCGIHCLFCLYFRLKNIPYQVIVNHIYTSNSCFNDRYVTYFVNKLVNYNLEKNLNDSIQICNVMINVLTN
jgi:hypothetical protein